MHFLRTCRSLLLVAGLVCAHSAGRALSDEPAKAVVAAPRTLAELAAYLRALDGPLLKRPEDERRELLRLIEATFTAAIGPDGKGLKPEHIEDLLICDQFVLSRDWGNFPERPGLCQRMSLAGLALRDEIHVRHEISLVGHLRLNPQGNLDAQGRLVTGAEWQAWRKKLLEYRLHPYVRLTQSIDPKWDPVKSRVKRFDFGGKYMMGIPRDGIADPELRARYEAYKIAAEKQSQINSEQHFARQELESYSKHSLKRALPYLYKVQPVTRADIEHLETELHASIPDATLRDEILEASVCKAGEIVAEGWVEKPPGPEVELHDRLEAEVKELKNLADMKDAVAVVDRLDKLREQLEGSPNAWPEYSNAARRAMYEVWNTPTGKSDLVKSSLRRLGLAALQVVKPTESTSVFQYQSLLILSLHSPDEKDLKPTELAEKGLNVWGPFAAALALYGPYDSRLPPAEQLPLPPPPEGYADWFSVGRSPVAMQNPDLRKRYEEVLSLRIDRMLKSGRAQELSELRDRYLPQLKKVLRKAYAGNRARELAGAAAITQRISNQLAREELIDSLTAASLNRDRMDKLDRMHDESPHWDSPESHEKPAPGAPQLSVEAPAGAVVIRGVANDGAVGLVAELAKSFVAEAGLSEKIDVAEDKYASFARLCDEDIPYHVVIVTGELTNYARQQRERYRMGSPDAFVHDHYLGQRRVLVVVNKANPMDSIDFAHLARAFGPDGPGARWQDLGGKGNDYSRAYGPAAGSWTRPFLQQTSMYRLREVQPGAYSKVRLPLRADLVACETARQVMDRVSLDPNGIGFLAWDAHLTSEDYDRVKVLAIAKGKETPHIPPREAVTAWNYPLSQSVYLYSLSDAPELAKKFCSFVSSPAAEELVLKLGVVRRAPKRLLDEVSESLER